MRHAGLLSGWALVGPPCTPIPGRSAVWGRDIMRPERAVLSGCWCSAWPWGRPVPARPLWPWALFSAHVLSVGTRAPSGDSPPPEPSSAAAPRQQGLCLLWGLLWGRGGPLPPAGISRDTLGCPHLLRLLFNNLPFQLARRSRAWRPYCLLVSFE